MPPLITAHNCVRAFDKAAPPVVHPPGAHPTLLRLSVLPALPLVSQVTTFLAITLALRNMSRSLWPGLTDQGALYFKDLTVPAVYLEVRQTRIEFTTETLTKPMVAQLR